MEQPNQTYINSLSGDDEAFKQKLINIIKKEFPEEKQEYFDNYNAKNFTLAADNVHKLKHKISILGLEKSYDVAVAYEMNLLEGSTDQKDEFEAILNAITKYLEDI
ncbi:MULTISPECIES: Hpt domain-containing protein [unclassified Algibacter]|uniref:Hpt domain-containing protein n=1 Tax=unclassified Algibacter TaxID=2615009 RepID=UPI00131E5E8F|nr:MULTISPECIES: Hpt domain-containing protein [unclassified Algibacter]MCL5128191.1 Hpt domain-containing protein [Algibacter sp. L4_22]